MTHLIERVLVKSKMSQISDLFTNNAVREEWAFKLRQIYHGLNANLLVSYDDDRKRVSVSSMNESDEYYRFYRTKGAVYMISANIGTTLQPATSYLYVGKVGLNNIPSDRFRKFIRTGLEVNHPREFHSAANRMKEEIGIEQFIGLCHNSRFMLGGIPATDIDKIINLNISIDAKIHIAEVSLLEEFSPKYNLAAPLLTRGTGRRAVTATIEEFLI